MTVEIIPFENRFLEPAAALVADRYGRLRAVAPALPSRFSDPAVHLEALRGLTEQVPGVAALQCGQLVGFFTALLLPSFRGRPGVYSPEWAHGARLVDADVIYRELYRALAAKWVDDGYLLHALTLFANDSTGLEAWHWLGFGMIVADAIRDLAQVTGSGSDAEVSQASVADLDDLRRLHLGLSRHLASAPIFVPMTQKWDQERYRQWLEMDRAVTWLARSEGRVVAWMRAETGNEGAGELVRDGGTVAITGAYTEPGHRSAGLATTLLRSVRDWAADQGAVRISVDFETQNIDGARFWLRHFQPVAYSVLRQVDDRILS